MVTEPAVPPSPGPGPLIDPPRPMTEDKALWAALGGAVGAPLAWGICTYIWWAHMPEHYAIPLMALIGGVCAGGAAYLAPRNRFKVP